MGDRSVLPRRGPRQTLQRTGSCLSQDRQSNRGGVRNSRAADFLGERFGLLGAMRDERSHLAPRARAVLGRRTRPGVDVIFPMQVSGVAETGFQAASNRTASDLGTVNKSSKSSPSVNADSKGVLPDGVDRAARRARG